MLWLVVVLLVAAGIAGIVVPGLPGTGLVFLGLLLGAWIDGFEKVGAIPLVVIGLLAALSSVADIAMTSLGVKKFGATKWALVGAACGALAGFSFGIPGFLFGPFLGALAAELITTRDLRRAGRAGLGTWLGVLLGILLRFALVVTMIGVFLVAYLF